MAWQSTLVTMTRRLIGDTDMSDLTYDATDVKETIITAAILVSQEFPFSTDYDFDIGAQTISPDPTASSTYDADAIALWTLRAACMLDMNKYQAGVDNGIRVRDGDSEVDTTGRFRGFRDVIELGPCASYQKILKQANRKRSMSGGRAIVSPATHPDSAIHGGHRIANFFDCYSRH